MFKRFIIFLTLAGCCPSNCPTVAATPTYPDGVKIPTPKSELCDLCDEIEDKWHEKMMEACVDTDAVSCPERLSYHYGGLVRECEFQRHLWGCEDQDESPADF